MAVLTLSSCGTLGDHFPFLALGRALVQRGHEVRYSAPLYLRPRIEECGMEFRRGRPEWDPSHVKNDPSAFDHWKEERGGKAAAKDENLDIFAKMEVENRLADLQDACQGADMLLCSHLQPVGGLVSKALNIPWVTICVTPSLYPSPDTSAAKGQLAKQTVADHGPAARRFFERIDLLRQELGMELIGDGDVSQLFESSRVLLATSPLFGTPASRPERELIQTGFWLHDPPGWSAWRPPDDLMQLIAEKPCPLVMAFSSQPLSSPEAILDVHLAAARRLGRVLIAQAGWAELSSPRFKEACDRQDAYLFPEGPQDWLFSQAGAVITHGGIGTIARALRAGAPILVEPFGNDQFYNSRQVLGLGVGAAVNPHRLTAEGVARVLAEKVLPEAARLRAHDYANRLNATDAVQQACTTIERWLVQ
jgi:UDP:flavonoid glycosyltransferase YjiC (YdhE family)